MAPRISHIQPGFDNFPLCTDIYDYVPLLIVTYVDPPIGAETNAKHCRLVRDVTKHPPTFPTNPVCFTLPDQAESPEIFIAAMRATVAWNRLSVIKSNTTTSTDQSPKPGRISHHSKIWRYQCPCASSPRKESITNIGHKNVTKRIVNTTVNKDRTIEIRSKNVVAKHTVTTTTNGLTKKTVVATEVTGDPLTQSPVKSRKREPSVECQCPAKFFI